MDGVETIIHNNIKIAVVHCDAPVMGDADSALEFCLAVKYETGCDRIVVPKEAFAESFYILSTEQAGEILQKFINYHIKIGIYGDFSKYAATSKPLRDFIYESNKGADVSFMKTAEEAVEKLGNASLDEHR